MKCDSNMLEAIYLLQSKRQKVTSRNKVFIENLIIAQLVENSLPFMGT